MSPITDPVSVARYARLFGEMMSAQDGEEYEFNAAWVRRRGWKVVPVESMARIPVPDIPKIVTALSLAGYQHCILVFNEPGYIRSLPVVVPSDPPCGLSTCYKISVDQEDFNEVNRVMGPFRFIMSDESRSWAISCNESYNLFAAEPNLLETILGRSYN